MRTNSCEIITTSTKIAVLVACLLLQTTIRSETLRQAESLEKLLKAADVADLVRETQLRGDPRRGALVFYRSAAACVQCHSSGEGPSPLGPNLAKRNEGIDSSLLTDEYLIESLLYPSKHIRAGFETVSLLTDDGRTITGIVVEENPQQLALRSASDLTQGVTINKDSIETRSTSKLSMMPEGLISALRDQSQFFDLASYVIQVARGGSKVADELMPSADQLAIQEDWLNLDHAGILKKLNKKDLEAGQAIYQGFCIDCHGADGNRPALSTARAFGTQKMKFGAEPLPMFMTLSRGNGLMGAMSHLTPKERYQVIHYIRERFMKSTNAEYSAIDQRYLASLPKGTEDGTAVPTVDRDFGPALGSQLERRFPSVLTMRIGENVSLCYDLHTMNQADIWNGGFLNLDETQHIRDRGEGTARPRGESIAELQGWQWGHGETLDYSRDGLLPRGPMPPAWMDYRGYFLHGTQVVLSYRIDGRSVLETVHADEASSTIRHQLEIEPGKPLVLSVAQGPIVNKPQSGVVALGQSQTQGSTGNAKATLAMSCSTVDQKPRRFTAAAIVGQTESLTWTVDAQTRLVLTIPASHESLRFDVVCHYGSDSTGLELFGKRIQEERLHSVPTSLAELTQGGGQNWNTGLKTVGALGLQRGAYALDTITIPEATPWKTWFRTSALDFLSDGRMVVTTYGGDVWIVSGIDDTLLNLEWKRFAAGLYEPFGVKVVDDSIYVTCKDRIVRLHDQDNNGEADFYESFSADTDVSIFFHAFNFDLQTDSKGNFYYAKGGHDADFALPGAVIRISPDGKQRRFYSTGFRVPNGMGSMPGDRMTCSDNQGQWMPASKVSLLREGGFYGWVPTYNGKDKWSADGGKIDTSKVVPPKTFDQPMVWMPQEFDNSSGGQLWVDDPRWGPLSGRLLHMSFGKGWMSYLMIQEVAGQSQAAIIKLPFDFRTGIMRGRVNPKDGQVYATGLQGWNGEGRIGLLDQGIQRLRYTGKPIHMVSDCKVESDGLRIDFNFAVEPVTASNIASYMAEHWNYRWQASYGSEQYSPTTGKIGAEKLKITSVDVSKDRKSIKLHASNLQPVNQLHLILRIKADDGIPFDEEIYWTIHRIP